MHGEIPESCNIQFKDGDSTNVDPDNLYLVSRKYQVRENQNGGKQLPFELRKAIKLIYKLKNEINEK